MATSPTFARSAQLSSPLTKPKLMPTMNTEDIKVGETYNVRMHVSDYCDGIIFCSTVIGYDDKDGLQCGEEYEICHDEVDAFSPITPYTPLNLPTMTKIPEAYPKYDPNREFKAGDIVSPRFWCMRPPTAYYISDVSGHFMPDDGAYEVEKDELPDSTVLVKYKGEIISMQACHLELTTPVEELEPYFVGESENSYDLFRKTSGCNQLRASFWWKHNPTPELIELSKANAKAAAEAERDRLNAEWRKEQA